MSTTNQQTEQQVKLTASQRLEGLEQALPVIDQAVYNLMRQVQSIQDALTLLNDKVSAVVTALSNNLPVNDSTIDQISMDQKVKEMKTKVEGLLSENLITKSEEVTKNSFVVVRELEESSSKVLNPRLQFVARMLDDDTLKKILTKKVGDSLKLSDESLSIVEIEEIYEINKNENTQPLAQTVQTQQLEQQG